MSIFKRKRRLPDGTMRQDDTYTVQVEFKGKTYAVKTPFTAKSQAEKHESNLRWALQAGRFDVLDQVRMRRPAAQTTLGELFGFYRAGAEISAHTVEANINAAKNIVRQVEGQPEEQKTISIFNSDLVWKFKQKVLERAKDQDDRRDQQLKRSANSLLRQARSLFTPHLMSYYRREAKITIPDSIRGFMDEPTFKQTGKKDYMPPSDQLLARTFDALEKLVNTEVRTLANHNMYLAAWLALGFGLRKSEIAECRNNWFITRDGVTFIRGDVLAKDHTEPDVRVQLGAWDKIKPELKGAPEDFVLAGHKTERSEEVFRRISQWMRELGWETQKAIHEFRAYAGCKVAEANGLLAAKEWMRHTSYTTTETFYGRYIKMKVDEVKLHIHPQAEFVPRVVEQ